MNKEVKQEIKTSDDQYCYYSGLPSPMAYVNDKTKKIENDKK